MLHYKQASSARCFPNCLPHLNVMPVGDDAEAERSMRLLVKHGVKILQELVAVVCPPTCIKLLELDDGDDASWHTGTTFHIHNTVWFERLATQFEGLRGSHLCKQGDWEVSFASICDVAQPFLHRIFVVARAGERRQHQPSVEQVC